MTANYAISRFVKAWPTSLFATFDLAPWLIVQRAEILISDAVARLGRDYHLANGFAVHETAQVEAGVVLKGPGIIGPRCLVAAGAYLRGGTYLGQDCIIGPSSELKTRPRGQRVSIV